MASLAARAKFAAMTDAELEAAVESLTAAVGLETVPANVVNRDPEMRSIYERRRLITIINDAVNALPGVPTATVAVDASELDIDVVLSKAVGVAIDDIVTAAAIKYGLDDRAEAPIDVALLLEHVEAALPELDDVDGEFIPGEMIEAGFAPVDQVVVEAAAKYNEANPETPVTDPETLAGMALAIWEASYTETVIPADDDPAADDAADEAAAKVAAGPAAELAAEPLADAEEAATVAPESEPGAAEAASPARRRKKAAE